MDKGIIAHKRRQEGACRDRARRTPGQVLQIGDLALDHLVVLFPHGELPDALAADFASLAELVHQRLVGAHHTGGVRAQGDDDRPGEGGELNDRLWVVALGVEQRI